MERPTVKRAFAIAEIYRNQGLVTFYADPNLVDEHCIEDFGDLYFAPSTGWYRLHVNKRYDFDEVLAFLQTL